MKKIELLSPAGNMESIYAAVQAGADAVYMGGNKFSARAFAENFDNDKIIETINYCHLYGVKVYITLNILIKDTEINEALKYIEFLYNIGTDALIVQDLGISYLIKKYFPEFEIHASTQMTIHNSGAALQLKELGFKRIVLARELSLSEITHISKDMHIETEVFVHGALCISYSGQCLMSSLIGGRSGNRGRCAQPCRLPFTLQSMDESMKYNGYIMSPKDMCTIDIIKGLVDSGTSSLKIEGRMKRPEYVAGVTHIYRDALDSLYENKPFDVERSNKNLLKLFNREGFSKAYLMGNSGKDMMAYSFPRNTGILLGKVENDLSINLKEGLNKGDGVRYGDEGFNISKIIKSEESVMHGSEEENVFIYPQSFKKDDLLYKTSDLQYQGDLSNYYKNPFARKISLDIEVEFRIGYPIKLAITYKDKTIVVMGDTVQVALTKPLDKEKIILNLQKTGNTPYVISNINFTYFEDGFLPLSSINSIRRSLIDSIDNMVLSKSRPHIELTNIDNKDRVKKALTSLPEDMIFVSDMEQLKAASDCHFPNIVVDIFSKNNNIDKNILEEESVFLKIPNIIRNESTYIESIIKDNITSIKGIVTSNLGIIKIFKNQLNIIGDYKLNIFNSYSLCELEGLIDGSCVSLELNKGELLSVFKNSVLPLQLLLYGKAELMVTEYCPMGSLFGNNEAPKGCSGICDKNSFMLKDRRSEEFIIKTDKFCRSHIYNSVPINLIPNLKDIRNNNINSFRFDFIDEDYMETKKVLMAYKNNEWPFDFNGYTRGHFKRGVE